MKVSVGETYCQGPSINSRGWKNKIKWYSFLIYQWNSQLFQKMKNFLKKHISMINFVILKSTCIVSMWKRLFFFPEGVSLVAWYMSIRPCYKLGIFYSCLQLFILCFLVIHCFLHVLGEIFGFMIASQTCCCLGLNLILIPPLFYLLFPVL